MLRQAIIAAEDGEFNTHMGVSITRIVVTLVNDIIHRRKRGASTLTQQLTRKLFLTDEKTWERKIKEAMLAHPDREALHQERDHHALLQSDSVGPRHLRRRGGGAPLLRQVGQGRDARGSGAARRHHPGAGAAQPLREPGQRAAPPQLRARADGRRGLHHRAAGRGRRRRSRSSPPAGPHLDAEAPFFVEDVRQHLEERFGARQLYENGLVGLHLARPEAAARRRAGARRRAAPARQAARLPQAAQRRRPSGTRIDELRRSVVERGAGRRRRRVVALVTDVDGPEGHVARRRAARRRSTATTTPGPARPPARS